MRRKGGVRAVSGDFLTDILAHKKSLLENKKAFFASLQSKIKDDTISRYRIFKKAISRPGQINLIAEVKKASPSRGVICPQFDAVRLARAYAASGAAAISILTEEKYFLGKSSYIRQVSEQVDIPILTKDFIIDEVQIYEAFYLGASAVLLIVALLDDSQLRHLMAVAARVDIDCLVEVHDEAELSRALAAGADIIGVNNRDLHTLRVDMTTSERLIPRIPAGTVIVGESGITTNREVRALRDAGAHAVLIGEAFLSAPDIAAKINEVMKG